MSNNNASFKSNFGLRLKAVRKQGGWNQGNLANELGISRDTLSRYERGELSPSLEVFSKMLDLFSALDVKAENMLFDDIEESTPPQVIGSWGWAKGFSFAKGGAFRVGVTRNDILRLTRELTEKLPDNNPFSSVSDDIKDYIYELEEQREGQLIGGEFELLVPMGQHSVSFKVEIPDDKTKVDEMFDKYLEEKAKVEKLQAEVDKLTQPKKSIKQSIKGSNHTIAGNDITINKK